MKGNGWVGGLISYIRSKGGHNATKMLWKWKKKCAKDVDGATEDGKWGVALASSRGGTAPAGFNPNRGTWEPLLDLQLQNHRSQPVTQRKTENKTFMRIKMTVRDADLYSYTCLFLYQGCVMFESLYSSIVLERLQCTFLNQSDRSVLKLLFSRLLFGFLFFLWLHLKNNLIIY